MTRVLQVFVVAAATLMGSATSFAQSATARSGGEHGNTMRASKTVFDFEDDMVEGELQRPDGIRVISTPPPKQPSLIEIRKDFVAEALKSVDDI